MLTINILFRYTTINIIIITNIIAVIINKNGVSKLFYHAIIVTQISNYSTYNVIRNINRKFIKARIVIQYRHVRSGLLNDTRDTLLSIWRVTRKANIRGRYGTKSGVSRRGRGMQETWRMEQSEAVHDRAKIHRVGCALSRPKNVHIC